MLSKGAHLRGVRASKASIYLRDDGSGVKILIFSIAQRWPELHVYRTRAVHIRQRLIAALAHMHARQLSETVWYLVKVACHLTASYPITSILQTLIQLDELARG